MPNRPLKINIGDDRYRLYFGPYRTPPFRMGQKVQDEWRGQVVIVGVTEGKIPWPIGKQGRHKSFVVYRGLAKALRKESPTAI